jgi:hypothetical protein
MTNTFFLEFTDRTFATMESGQRASSQPEAGRKEGRNTGDCLPTCPQSPFGRHLVASKLHPDRGRLAAAPRGLCKRRRKGRLNYVGQRGRATSSSVLTGRSQAIEEAETRFRAIDESWKPLEELMKF